MIFCLEELSRHRLWASEGSARTKCETILPLATDTLEERSQCVALLASPASHFERAVLNRLSDICATAYPYAIKRSSDCARSPTTSLPVW